MNHFDPAHEFAADGKRFSVHTKRRLTDCCGAHSTYMESDLCCKACYNTVPHGQGDGVERFRAEVANG